MLNLEVPKLNAIFNSRHELCLKNQPVNHCEKAGVFTTCNIFSDVDLSICCANGQASSSWKVVFPAMNKRQTTASHYNQIDRV